MSVPSSLPAPSSVALALTLQERASSSSLFKPISPKSIRKLSFPIATGTEGLIINSPQRFTNSSGRESGLLQYFESVLLSRDDEKENTNSKNIVLTRPAGRRVGVNTTPLEVKAVQFVGPAESLQPQESSAFLHKRKASTTSTPVVEAKGPNTAITSLQKRVRLDQQ